MSLLCTANTACFEVREQNTIAYTQSFNFFIY